MTEKDKRLLVFLAIFVTVVGFGYWGIYPLITSISDTNAAIREEKEIRDQDDLKIAELPMLQADNEKLESEITNTRRHYFDMMTSDAIDKYFTSLALKYNLDAYDLSIEMPTECTTLEAYQYSQKMEKQLDREEAEEAEESMEDEQPDNGIYKVSVTQKLGGSQKNFDKLINALTNSDMRILVSHYDYQDKMAIEQNLAKEFNIKSKRLLSITVDIYMCADK